VKLLRLGTPGAERPAVLAADGTLLDASGVLPDLDGGTLAGGGLDALRTAAAAGRLPPVADPAARVGPPLAGIGKIVCVGLNYADHAAETGAAVPAEPVLFLKAPDTVVGPNDEVLVPRGSVRTDWEVELAVVIGRTARYLAAPADAAWCIAGYTISHDVSERDFQLHRGGQWDKGKSCETFNPLGPWLVTADEVPDAQALRLRLWVNSSARQDGSTSDMVFGVHHLVWYVSQFMVLRPGDVINTGTPAGVALGRPGTPYLRAGDVVELEIDGLGRQRQVLGEA
jgi:2-keto-4-pentenoate hydratase/2-oxohepta-3-ene-1,7-dioic acid hydratase in catechol pathway